MRQIIVSAMRRLEAHGIGSALPDLPGMGESPLSLAEVRMDDWRRALSAFADGVDGFKVTAAFRGGALLDDAANASAAWRCAPEEGARLVRDLMRTRLTGQSADQAGDALILAGNEIQQSLIDTLKTASTADRDQIRTVRLMTDAAAADAKIAGTPVWRRSEPGDDDLLKAAIVEDLGQWAKQCAIS